MKERAINRCQTAEKGLEKRIKEIFMAIEKLQVPVGQTWQAIPAAFARQQGLKALSDLIGFM